MAKRPQAVKVCFHEWKPVTVSPKNWRRCIYCGKYQKQVAPNAWITAKM